MSVISERKTMYETAIANAEKAGDSGKARRYKRGLKVHSIIFEKWVLVSPFINFTCIYMDFTCDHINFTCDHIHFT